MHWILHQQRIRQVFIELKAKISATLQSANKISLCCDIWSKKELIGVTAHFFSRGDHRQHTVTLAVWHLTSFHTAGTIRQCVDEVLHDWDIDSSKIMVVLTDNGSNI